MHMFVCETVHKSGDFEAAGLLHPGVSLKTSLERKTTWEVRRLYGINIAGPRLKLDLGCVDR